MTAAEILAPQISERLSWRQICARYPNQWVYLMEIERSPNSSQVRSARVVEPSVTYDTSDNAKAWNSELAYTGSTIVIRQFPRVIVDDELRAYMESQPVEVTIDETFDSEV